jgi:hypothetical protein
VVLRGGDDLGDFVRNAVRLEEDLHLSIDVNPTRLSYLTRWGGKITTINSKRDSSGIHTVELIASAQREHLKHVLVGIHAVLSAGSAAAYPCGCCPRTAEQLARQRCS